MTNVLVTGATGKQGGAVSNLLIERGHAVTAYVRSPDSSAAGALADKGARLVVGDLADAEALGKAVADVDAVFGLSVPFGAGGKEQEVAQGTLLVDVAARHDVHLVYSSVRGADRIVSSDVAHASSKQIIEAHLRESSVAATVVGPTYFMENALNVRFNQLTNGVFAMPLSPDKKLDQVTVLDIAGMVAHAIENRDEMVGKRIDLASDSITGTEAAAVLSEILGREIPYRHLPIAQVRQWSGDEIGNMFQRFEDNVYFLDIAALRAAYPMVTWHSFADWARTIDWATLLA
jgi:uncharacterized protein YbjT (DUF2867 family)